MPRALLLPLFAVTFLLSASLFAEPNIPGIQGVPHLSDAEAESIVFDMAGKVILFQDIWRANPEARLGSGTLNELAGWVKFQLQGDLARTARSQARRAPARGPGSTCASSSDAIRAWKYFPRESPSRSIPGRTGGVFSF